MVQWKKESEHTHKVLFTFRWISVALILIVKKIAIPSLLSFPCSITTYIFCFRPREVDLLFPTSFASLGYFTSTLTVKQLKGTGTRWWLNPASIEVYGHLSFRSQPKSLFLNVASTPNPWRKEKEGESSAIKFWHLFIWRSRQPDSKSFAGLCNGFPKRWLQQC